MSLSLAFIAEYYLTKIPFKYPYILLLYIPLAIIIVYLLRKSFIIFTSKEDAAEYRAKTKGLRRFMILSRLMIFLLLVAALASPFRIEDKMAQSDPRIKIISDSSYSFRIFDTALAETLRKNLESRIPVELAEIAKDDRSPLGDGISNNIEAGDNISAGVEDAKGGV